ncbi:hypothetical protein D3C81_1444720 [compost metagenome]
MRHSQLFAQLAHLILEQGIQRLDQAELHVFRQSADIVMRFDGLRRCRAALHNIGVQRPLGKEREIPKLGRFFVEAVDELIADDFTLLFGIRDTRQLA